MPLTSRSVLLLVLAATAAPLVATSGFAAETPRDKLVRVSGASPYEPACFDVEAGGLGRGFQDAETEVTLAVDPRRPSRLIAGWMQDLYAGYATAASADGGATWSAPTVVPGVSTCSGGDAELGADPWLSIGADGTAYLSGFSLDLPDPAVPAPVRSRLQVNTSRDGGRSWSSPRVIADDLVTLHDKPAVTADPHRAGRAYLVWTQESTAFGPLSTGISFVRTSDAGVTWSTPRTVLSPNPPTLIPHGSELLILPDDTLVVLATLLPGLVPETGRWLPHTVQAVRSTDGGATWSTPLTVAEFSTGDGSFHSGSDPASGDRLQAPSSFIGADVAPDGTLYVVWRHALSDKLSEVRLSRSTDRGVSWTPPRAVATPRSLTFLPHVAVAGDGTVGVTYHDVRGRAPDDAFIADVWLSRSQDGGRTWTEERLAGPLDLRTAPMRDVPSQGRFLGDYHGLVGLPGGFVAALALPAPLARIGATDVFAVRRPSSVGPRHVPRQPAAPHTGVPAPLSGVGA